MPRRFFPRGNVWQEMAGRGLPAKKKNFPCQDSPCGEFFSKKTAKEHKCDLAGYGGVLMSGGYVLAGQTGLWRGLL